MIKYLTQIMIVLFPLLSVAQRTAEIVFPSAIEVSPRSVITAFDVIETKNMHDELASQLKNIELGDATTTKIEKKVLISKLRNLKAKFLLPSEMKILRSRQAVSRMELERKIKNHLTRSCENCDLQIQVSSVPMNMTSDWELDLNVDLTKTSVMIPIRSIFQNEKKGWIVGEIKRYQYVPVLNRAVKSGDVITSDLISLEKRQLLNPREVIVSSEHMMGMQAARYLSAGQTINYSDLKKELVLKKGQMVKAIAGQAFFEISIFAQVEESGSIGDVIKIKNMDSQKIVAARIVEKGLVRIE
ncbi:MAG: flagella basal body P-ring formation protein FlgA [Bdellovibrionales bacterium RIFCSPHIGHO2_01_FULL_40_29]|nr:MAG: flagella basal body P-ring formation protein FlgA [Bdellovibrionales bacterium RIFCSPHIGHO2_01_FULL_40_29]OFZ34116.1 MAG: flagella basal body P-ring formation protein FlgA [Bdellovibrionales bacterium RIFCSPHIGHO2_02_FULL_40_15]